MAVNRFTIMNNVIIKTWVHDRIENGIMLERAHYEEKPAVLLHWGIAYEELKTGTGMFTVAFVRLEDGSVCNVYPSDIRFIIDDKISKLEASAPKQESPYPKVMMVSNDGSEWLQRVVFLEKNSKFIAWSAETIKDAERAIYTSTWNYAKDIESIPSYTMEELFEKLGEKFTIKD